MFYPIIELFIFFVPDHLVILKLFIGLTCSFYVSVVARVSHV